MIATSVERVSESEFFDRLKEIEEEFGVKLDDLGIEWSQCTHPEDVDDEMAAIRRQVEIHIASRDERTLLKWLDKKIGHTTITGNSCCAQSLASVRSELVERIQERWAEKDRLRRSRIEAREVQAI